MAQQHSSTLIVAGLLGVSANGISAQARLKLAWIRAVVAKIDDCHFDAASPIGSASFFSYAIRFQHVHCSS